MADRRSHWALLLSLTVPHRRHVAALGVVLAFASAVPLAGPLLLKSFIDEAAAGAETSTLVRIAAAFVVVGIVSEVTTVAVAYAGSALAWTATNDLRADLAAHTLGLDLGFHRRTTAGELVERVDGDVSAVSEFLATFAVQLVGAALTLVGIAAVVLVEDWRIGLVLVAYVVVAARVLVGQRDASVVEAEAERAATAVVLGGIEERLDGLDDLRANGGGGHSMAVFDEQSAALMDRATERQARTNRIWIATNGVFAVGWGIALGGGALAFRSGWISLGTVFLLFQYVERVRRPLELMTEDMQQVQQAAGGMRRIASLLADGGRQTDGDATLPAGATDVVLDGVTAAYDDGVAVLHDVTLRVPAGRSLAVVGPTGAGKTTIARLITRQIDPQGGTVRIAGVDLRDVRTDDRCARIGLVTQDVHIFSASVRDNVTVFRSCADDDTTAALDAVGLGAWLAGLDQGLDTLVGPGGVGTSAGEAQLLALARLFLRDPGVVVLDEASSRIDPDTEARVSAALGRLLAGRTAVLIAHRLATIAQVDEVAVVDGGRVVEHGPRSALLADPTSRFSTQVAAAARQEHT